MGSGVRYVNVIDWLSKVDAGALERLRSKYPDAGELLSSRRDLGAPRSGSRDSVEKEAVASRTALVDLASLTVGRVIADLDGLISVVRVRMRSISYAKFFGALIALAAGSVETILVSLGAGTPTTAVVGATFAAIGGATALFADFWERAPSGIRIAAVDEYGKLVDLRGKTETMKSRIERSQLTPVSNDDFKAMLEDLDNAAAAILRLKLA